MLLGTITGVVWRIESGGIVQKLGSNCTWYCGICNPVELGTIRPPKHKSVRDVGYYPLLYRNAIRIVEEGGGKGVEHIHHNI